MATITVRTLDGNWDPRRGSGLSNFLADGDAVAQIIATRIKLLQGEWFENTTEGLPLFQQLLGNPITLDAIANIMRARILSAPYVTGILSLQVVSVPAGRTFAFSAVVTTAFGIVTVSNTPTANNAQA